MTQQRIPIEDRFWPKVNKRGPDDCWEWQAWSTPSGYGMIRRYEAGRWSATTAHRVAYELANGPIPDDLNVLHRCDNPRCCNPGHLFLGTYADNIADRDAKQRQARGNRIGQSKLNPEQVAGIRVDTRSNIAIGRIYGISDTAVGLIKRRKTWRHVEP